MNTTARESTSTTTSKSHSSVITFGPGVLDTTIRPTNTLAMGDKCDCHVAMTLGGGAANVARELRRHEVAAHSILLVGDDDGRAIVARLARCEFGELASVAPLMESTRRSILVGSRTYTVRSQLRQTPLGIPMAHAIAKSDWTVVAPFAAADVSFVGELLRYPRRSVLQLSSSQLADRDVANHLARKATLVVVNQAELSQWTGLADPQAGIERLLEHGLRNLVITSDYRVLGRLQNEWLSLEVPRIPQARHTSGAGDTFVGALVAGLVRGESARPAVEGAISAAHQFIAARNRRQTENSPPVAEPHFLSRLRLQAASLASLASTSLLGWLPR